MIGILWDDWIQVFSILIGTLSTYLRPKTSVIQSTAAISVLSSRHAWWGEHSGQDILPHTSRTDCIREFISSPFHACSESRLSLCKASAGYHASNNMICGLKTYLHNAEPLKFGETVINTGNHCFLRCFGIIPMSPSNISPWYCFWEIFKGICLT